MIHENVSASPFVPTGSHCLNPPSFPILHLMPYVVRNCHEFRILRETDLDDIAKLNHFTIVLGILVTPVHNGLLRTESTSFETTVLDTTESEIVITSRVSTLVVNLVMIRSCSMSVKTTPYSSHLEQSRQSIVVYSLHEGSPQPRSVKLARSCIQKRVNQHTRQLVVSE